MSKKHIEECIRENLEGYFKDLRGVEPNGMYDMILRVVEKPLLEVVMQQAENNQSRDAEWLGALADRQARARVSVRVLRMAAGNFGDCKALSDGVWELRIDHGPGYRVYFVQKGDLLVVLLAGGDKSTQDRDIRIARELARDL